jgi:protein TonB
MASPAKITEVLPETLPGDFVEWDEAPPSTHRVESGGGEADPSVGVISKSATQSAESYRAGTPSGNLPRGTAVSVLPLENSGGAAAAYPAQSLSPALLSSHDMVEPLQAGVPALDEIRFSAARQNGGPATATKTEFDEILLRSSRTNRVAITWSAKKKSPIIAGAGATLAITFAIAMIATFNRGGVSSAKPAAAPELTVATNRQPEGAETTRTHSALPTSTPAAPHRLRNPEPVQEAVRRPVQKDAGPTREQPELMDDQLHRPTRLRMKGTLTEQAPLPPGGFAAVDVGGADNNTAIGTVFGSPKQPTVQIASQPVISIPSSVALDLLIHKTQPAYPVIAKEAGVSGTIVLTATISKAGNVENLRVVSGSFMLRGSAVDAVRAWRFKPYMLDNHPTAFETTINVHFCGQQSPCVQGRE